MTAEGTACNGAGEAPRAEFAPEKAVAAAAAPEEEKAAAGEEDLGGPFVIVNGGDSDGGHSDRGSDLGKAAPDEDSAPSEVDDAPGSNAAPDAAVGTGDHGAAEGGEEVGAPGAAALGGASSADGGDRPSDGSAEGEPSSDCVAEEAPQQEAVGEEDGGAAAPASVESEPAVDSADSEAPPVDSEIEGKEGTVDESAVADVAEAVVHQEASTEQDADAAVKSSGHDDALSSPESSSAAMESEVIREEEDSKEQSTTDVMAPQEQGTVGGHDPAMESSAAMESELIREEEDSKEQSTIDVAEPQEQGTVGGHHDDAMESSSAAMETEVIREEEDSKEDVVEPQKQGTVGASALVENEHLCADMKADSFVAATEPDSQEDATVESCRHEDAQICTESGSADIEPDSQEDAAVESCRHDDARICTESGSADIESEVNGEDSKQEENNADVVEVERRGVGREDALMANGHPADTQADSLEATTEPENHANESKLTEVAESVEEDAASGEQDVTDASSQTNGHIYVALSADSGIVESKAHTFETDGQVTDQQQEEAQKTEAEVLEGVLKPTERNCAASVEELVGEEVDADGHDSLEGTADSSGEQEGKPIQVEGEATCGILEFEEVDKDGEEGLCDNCVVGVVSSNEETKVRIDEAAPSVNVGESEEVTENTSQDTMQGGLAKDAVSVGTIFVKLGSDPYVESSLEHKVKAEVDLVDEITPESDLKAPLHPQQDCESVMETIEHEKVEASGGCQTHEIENFSEVELKKEFEMEVDDAAAASAASVFHHEPRSIDLGENDSCNNFSPTTVLESCDHVQTEESRSQEISVSVEQPVCSASLEHGTVVVDEAAGNGCKEKSSNEPVNLNIDELVVDDDQPSLVSSCEHARLDKPGCISKKDDSSEIVEDSRSLENGSRNEAPHLTEPYENGNEPAKSSDVVETKCAEALATEPKDNGHHAFGECHGDHAQVIIPQKVYIIKVPKFAGDDLWNKIQAAQAHLDQLTQERDAINRRRQKQKAVCDQYREKLEAARQEEREARAAHGEKKNDLNSVRSVLGKLHQANSVEELDELIAKKERTYQHETISFNEEKLLVKEIKALKAQRKQLSATMGSKAEINEAFDQKDHIHERHKVLKKDSDALLTNLKALEENTRKIQKCFEDERTALRKLTDEHRTANEIRQKAYCDWTELRNEPSKKNEYFFKYRDARNAAETFRANGDINGLVSHCNSQIERVMEMWNQNDDFRKQYVESNKVSTLKRLGTHDGRRLGPDEDPPVIPSRRPSNIYPLSTSSPEVPTLASTPAPVLAAPAAVPAKEDSFPVLAAPHTSKRAKSKASGSSAQIENNSVIVSEAEDLKQTLKEKARLLEEQLESARKAEELARKEEELRKERDAAEKERLRMEQKVKAKEAEERKRRKAEKDKERAEFKARKEAEEREKKKAKKDKKKGTTPADSSAIGDSNAAALATADTDSNASDNPREAEVSQPAAPKRLSRPAAAIKQLNRLQPMPAPLRNRGRRKLRQYILIAAAVLSVLALFVAGNYIPRLKSVHS